MEIEINRAYHMPDADMLELALVKHGHFITDKTSFTAFAPVFADPFGQDFFNLIDSAQATSTDEQVEDQISSLTMGVEQKMAECREVYQKAKFYVLEAFPEDLGIRNSFGFDDYDHARNRQSELINFMRRAYDTALEHKSKMNAVGFNNARIAELKTLSDDLRTANHAQESLKDVRLDITRARRILMNDIWNRVRKVCSAGKLIFTDNYAKHHHYVIGYSSGSGGSGGSENQVFTGIIEQGETIQVFDLPFDAGQNLILNNTGNSDLEFLLGDDEGNVSTPIQVNAQSELSLGMGGFDVSGNLLLVRTLVDTDSGSFEVTVNG